jgi:hypothetical protein
MRAGHLDNRLSVDEGSTAKQIYYHPDHGSTEPNPITTPEDVVVPQTEDSEREPPGTHAAVPQ